MRDLIGWKDEVVEHPSRYKEVANTDGTIDHVREPGEIIQTGTPVNAANLNSMDQGTWAVQEEDNELLRMALLYGDEIDALKGETIKTTLTNTQTYPFNNSKTTIQLSETKMNTDYTVDTEVTSVTGGAVGDFYITDKLVNGFKIQYTGSASSVAVTLHIRGGI